MVCTPGDTFAPQQLTDLCEWRRYDFHKGKKEENMPIMKTETFGGLDEQTEDKHQQAVTERIGHHSAQN